MIQNSADESLLHKLFDEMWNNRKLSIADEIMVNDIKVHVGTTTIKGSDEFKKVVETWCKAIPDLYYTLDEVIVSGDKMVARWHGTGTLTGELGPIKPTGKPIDHWGITIMTIQNNKFQEAWVASDFTDVVMGG